ncbi:MAG: hypothetical protein AABX70_06640 [Nanoarchaeota archaeon]
MAAPEMGFVFGIRIQRDVNGNFVGYQVQSESKGLPEETILTIVRNWIRAAEDNYYKKFTGKDN